MPVCVDTMLYLHKFRGDLNSLVAHCCGMLRNNLFPVYVFEGGPCPETTQQQHLKKRKKKKKRVEVLSMVPPLKRLLHLTGIPVAYAQGYEADIVCAYLCSSGTTRACLTEDVDILLHGAAMILSMKHDVLHVLTPGKVIGDLRITRTQLLSLACLLGNDYQEGPRIAAAEALDLVIAHPEVDDLNRQLPRGAVDKKVHELFDVSATPEVADRVKHEVRPDLLPFDEVMRIVEADHQLRTLTFSNLHHLVALRRRLP